MSAPTEAAAYVAALWEHPALCVALFGIQLRTEAGRALYESSGVHEEMLAALEQARQDGLLLDNRFLMAEEGPLLLQYWRSYADMDAWARHAPHSRWWKWLVENRGSGVAVYHEIYQAKTAEAIYEAGMPPVGPARFCSTVPVSSGEGRSKDRQARFAEASR